MHTTSKASALSRGFESPIKPFFSRTSFNSKHYISEPKAKETARTPMLPPGLALLHPKWKKFEPFSFPLKPLWLDLSGSSQALGSLCKTEAFTNRIVQRHRRI
ncbi:hypothetical protein CsSME_00013960 [Camellia sinensis var. sinensis]